MLNLEWKNGEMEELKNFKYPGYAAKENNEDEGQIKTVAGKAKSWEGFGVLVQKC